MQIKDLAVAACFSRSLRRAGAEPDGTRSKEPRYVGLLCVQSMSRSCVCMPFMGTSAAVSIGKRCGADRTRAKAPRYLGRRFARSCVWKPLRLGRPSHLPFAAVFAL